MVQSDGNSATAYFEDGASDSADFLVGAEGAHSKVREYLLGNMARLEPSPLAASVTMAKLPSDATKEFTKLHPRSTISFHPNGYFLWLGGEPPSQHIVRFDSISLRCLYRD